MNGQTNPVPSSKDKFNFSINLKIVIFILLAVIAGMLVAWKPWQNSLAGESRTVKVTGEAKISAEPDEFVFYPNYLFTNSNKDAALKDLTKKSEEVIAKLKDLGVKDSSIKTNSSGGDFRPYSPSPDNSETTYTLGLIVTVKSREEAQKVQNYLVTTGPTASVSPRGSFSDTKRKELETQARDKAINDARAKADQSAKNLGFKVGKVKSLEDGAGFNDIYKLHTEGDRSASSFPQSDKIAVQPGENDLHYSITIVYYVR